MKKHVSCIVLIGILGFGLLMNACRYNSSSQAEQTNSAEADETSMMDPAADGRYAVSSTQDNLASDQYASAIIFYPAAAEGAPYPATTLCCGFAGYKERVEWLARRMASHGFVVIAFTPLNVISLPPMWEKGHKGALQTLLAENVRPDSPVYGMVDPDRLSLAGHSMGARGALLAAEDLGVSVKSVIALCPWTLDIPKQLAFDEPTLFVTGSGDFVALPSRVKKLYDAHPETSDKMFIKIKGLVHTDMENPGAHHEIISAYVIAWLQYYVARQPDYFAYLLGRADPSITEALAEFAYYRASTANGLIP